MKKGLYPFLGLVMLVAVALMPTTSFAATFDKAAQTATSHHSPHFLLSKDRGQSHANAAQATSGTSSDGGNLVYNGGPVMAGTAQIYAIFWEPTDNVSANYNSLIQRYFNDVSNSSLYQVATQYGLGGPSGYTAPYNSRLAGVMVDHQAYPESPLLDSDIQNEVNHARSLNSWGYGNGRIFFVFTEKNENICQDSTQAKCASNAFCAYHNFFNVYPNSNPAQNAVYAAVPYAASFNCKPGVSSITPNNDDADQTINVTWREQMDAATDPLLNAWSDANGNEISDKCAWDFDPVDARGADATMNNNPYLIQQEWSNAVNSCVLNPNNNGVTKYYRVVNRASGLELDVYGGGTNDGARVIQWTDHGGTNQQWGLVHDGNAYQIENLHSALVIDVFDGATNDGAPVIQWASHNGTNQQWTLVPDGNYDLIKNVNSGLVLGLSGGATNAGVQVIQQGYTGALSQQWSFIPAGITYNRITPGDSALVLDVYGGSSSPGAPVIQWTDHDGTNQQWTLISDGTNPADGNSIYQIENLNSGLVLDVAGGSKAAGAQIIQWINHNGTNQQWEVLVNSNGANRIVNVNSGLVLDVYGGSTNPGASVIQWVYHAGINQQWYITPTSM